MRKKLLPPIHPGEILLEEFLKPLGITQARLAKEIGVPAHRSIAARRHVSLRKQRGHSRRQGDAERHDPGHVGDRHPPSKRRDVGFRRATMIESRPSPLPE